MGVKELFDELGLNVGYVVAGISGGIISLTFEKKITFGKAILLIFTGAFCATYLTPIVGSWIRFSIELQNGSAFVIGIIAMKLVAGIMKYGEAFAKDPKKAIKSIRR